MMEEQCKNMYIFFFTKPIYCIMSSRHLFLCAELNFAFDSILPLGSIFLKC